VCVCVCRTFARSWSGPSAALGAQVHPDYLAAGGLQLVGKTWDLASAYRQLARSPSDACLAVVAAWLPSLGRAAFFEQLAMPFGGTASVHFFVWVARAPWVLLVRGHLVVSGHWVDDFPVVEMEINSDSAQLFINRFF